MELRAFILLPLLAAIEHPNICTAQTGVCYRSVSSSVPVTTYSSATQLSSYSCGWLGTSRCFRTTYRRVSTLTFQTVYSSTFGCCSGYLQSGMTCTPICSPECSNNGTCTAPNTCMCQPGWTGDTCQTDIDECASETDNCEQVCTNTQGSFQCSCNDGYSLDLDGYSCSDINECNVQNGNCAHICTNSEGTFQCSCRSGYSLGSDNLNCLDIDECQTNNGGCEHVCSNTEGSRTCSCNSGYTLSSNNINCADINECQTNNGGCGQVCGNSVGSFECSCNQGFVLASNGFDCTDIDECQTNMGGCQHSCFNTVGSFTCDCRPGYSLASDGSGCSDINECQSNNGGCEQNCMNTVGSFECSCDSGYTLGSDGSSCSDINECQSNVCEQNCANTVGSFQCSCREGYALAGDGRTCNDINECQSNNGGCEQNCMNTVGSFECSCDSGYTLGSDGSSCSDINECQSNICEQNCANTVGSFQCSCREGYILAGDGHTCNDINECQSNNGGCEQNCLNTAASFECSCNSGYTLGSDGSSCSDINECQSNIICEQNCANTVGSFQCSCREGYALDGDGRTCNEAVPSMAPTITGLVRTSATSGRITWDPIPHQNRNGELVSYHLGYSVAVNGSCLALALSNELTTSASASDTVGFLTNLDPLNSYCVRVAGATSHGVGVFGRLWKMSLYDNSLFQVRFSGVTNCSEWMVIDRNEKVEYFTQSISSTMDSLCDCTTTGYIGETIISCDMSYPNEFIIQGRIVGTPTVSSNEIIEQLQTFVSGDPSSVEYQGQALSYVQRCSVELSSFGVTSCTSAEQSTASPNSPSEEMSTKSSNAAIEIPYELVGGVAGGVVLLIIIVVVIVIAVVIFKKIGRKRAHKMGSKNAVEMEPKVIDIRDVHKSHEEPLYEAIAENPYYKQLSQRYVHDKNQYMSAKRRDDQTAVKYYVNDNDGPSNEQTYEDMNDGCTGDHGQLQYNYVSNSAKRPIPSKQSKKDKAHNRSKKYKDSTLIATKENVTQPPEEYVEIKNDQIETKLDEANDFVYTDMAETAQNYEIPVSIKDNSSSGDEACLTYM